MAKPWLADQVKLLDRPLEPPKDASSAEKKAVATLEAALSAARKPLLQPEILSQVLEQLDILAAEERAKRQRIDRRIRRDDGKVSIAVDADEHPAPDWIDALPETWPDAAKTAQGKKYTALLKRVKDLERRHQVLELEHARLQRLQSLFDMLGRPEDVAAALPGGDPELLPLAKRLASSTSR